jgi:serine/threonine protein kinase
MVLVYSNTSCTSLTTPPTPLHAVISQSRSDDAVPIRWQCPEAVKTRVYTTKSDVYSYGVLLYEIFSGGATPFASLSTGEVMRAVTAGQRLARPRRDTPEDIVELLRDCTQLKVAQRPSIGVALERLSTAAPAAEHNAPRRLPLRGEPDETGALGEGTHTTEASL